MTVIAVKKFENKIQFACDSMISRGRTVVHETQIPAVKIFKQNDFVIGSTGKNYRPDPNLDSVINYLKVFVTHGGIMVEEIEFKA
jgi:hypothetical protein